MKKLILLVAVSLFVVGAVAFAPYYTPTFENIPISVNSSWRIGKAPWDYDRELLYLDLDITNNSNKTINNIRAFYHFSGNYNNGDTISHWNHGENILVFDTYEKVSRPDDEYNSYYQSRQSLTIPKGQTVRISLPLNTYRYIINYDFAEYANEREIEKVEVDFYVSWIRYKGLFAGQWGNAFGIPQWPPHGPDYNHGDNGIEYDLKAVTVKINVDTYRK